ncbi:MAG: ACT domain-containing protein [Hydrogenoanaerobacterium sp.]
MTIKQLSVFVENKPGRLAEITDTLENNNINIMALSVADTTNFGILRIIVNSPDKAVEALKGAGFTVSLTNVIAIGVNDCPGGLSKAMHSLCDAGMSVEYMYAFVGRKENFAYVILRVEDTAAAEQALTKSGVMIITTEDII